MSATALWSGNFIIARGLSESIPPVSLAFYRWVVAAIVFLPFALKPLLREWDCLRTHLPYLSMTALLGVTLFNTLIYFAGHTTTALNLSLISITFPIVIVILSRIIYGVLYIAPFQRGSGHHFLRGSYRHFPFLQCAAHCSRYTDSKL
jgi:drug/metabolite transporter (DMT)-like permease